MRPLQFLLLSSFVVEVSCSIFSDIIVRLWNPYVWGAIAAAVVLIIAVACCIYAKGGMKFLGGTAEFVFGGVTLAPASKVQYSFPIVPPSHVQHA